MSKLAVILLSLFSMGFAACASKPVDQDTIFKKYPEYADRRAKEVDQVFAFNQKVKSKEILKDCAKNEELASCFLKQLKIMHEKNNLTSTGLILVLAQGNAIALEEKERQRKENSKISNSQLSFASHKKQAQMNIAILSLGCSVATAKSWGFQKTELLSFDEQTTKETFIQIEKLTREEIELTRKYSELEGSMLTVEFEQALACRKKP